ncbi:acetylornithine deacetylase [Pelistega suis]|uniref:acetylornithine deacetylase n=1 Tax=Pelistega suis TaxID=1631957 RepID=UPI00211BF9AF|nr:acetylornithine deacetylase [Pelistega suis]MCQ9328905.1 acetylornithine deacetylase [Pelistega suis]
MQTTDILRQLISFNTISSESNLGLIEWIEQLLKEQGIYTERLEDESGLPKASLIARIGPAVEGGLILSGHTDVVPVKGQPWEDDPFVMRETAETFIGRGVCDMKGFIASAIAGALQWKNLDLRKPVYLAFSYDEEVGCEKAPRIAKRIVELGGQKAWAIIGEPTSLNPVVGQKGIVNIRTTLTGMAAHSSQILHQGLSAIHEGSKLVTCIEKVMQDLIDDGEINTDYNVPHSTLHVGMISGGIAYNVLARECHLYWEIRNLPEQDIHSVLARVQKYADELCAKNTNLKIETEFTSAVVPGLVNRNNDDLLTLLARHMDSKPGYVAYATEAGHFQQAGFQAVICGPGNIQQAHQPEEWVAKSQLQDCDKLLDALVKDACL